MPLTDKNEYNSLVPEMYTVYVESRLASPLSGSTAVEISPQQKVSEIVSNFLHSLEREDGIPGLAVFDKYYNRLDGNATLESLGIEEGSKFYIGHERPFFSLLHFAVIGISTIIIAAVLFITATVLFAATGGAVPFDYGIVIDAGSTHTEVFLYQWRGSKAYGTGEVFQKDFCKTDVRITSGDDPIDVVACVNKVANLVPMESPLPLLYLGATGGMRLLNMSNSKDTSLILMTLRYALKISKVQVKYVNVIEGADEAIFAWITTNFLAETLHQNQAQPTFGALDLGGASTQYAFAVNNVSNFSNTKMLKLYGQKYYVASDSFLCFGWQKAADRLLSVILVNQMNSSIVDPCYPKGFTLKVEAQRFAHDPCILKTNHTNFIPFHQTIPNTTQLLNDIMVSGSSDYEGCRANVFRLVNENSCKDMDFTQCIEKVNLSQLDVQFMAFSTFYYIVTFFNGTDSLDDFVNATKRWCSLTWDEIQQTHTEIDLALRSKYCFGAIYITELLTSNYGFNSSTWKNLHFQQQIENADLGWSMGFMINATNAIPEEMPSSPVISLAVFVPLVILSVGMVSIAILLLQKNFKRRSCVQGHKRLIID